MDRMERDQQPRHQKPRAHFFKHLKVMPKWHKAVLLIAAFVGIAGLAGYLFTSLGGDAHVKVTAISFAPAAASAKSAAPANGSANAGANATANPSANEQGKSAEASLSLGSISKISPGAMLIGFTILAGFVVGWYFRAFLAPVIVLALATAGGFWLMSYFGILHPETWNPEAFNGKSATPATWMGHYALALKEVTFAHLPSAFGGAFAACLGFYRP